MEETPASSSNPAGPNAGDTTNDHLAEKLRSLSLSQQAQKKRRNNRKLLPPWDTDFWRVYGNKLRVFGTVEEVCDLTSPAQDATESAAAKKMQMPAAVKSEEAKAEEKKIGLLNGLKRYFLGS